MVNHLPPYDDSDGHALSFALFIPIALRHFPRLLKAAPIRAFPNLRIW